MCEIKSHGLKERKRAGKERLRGKTDEKKQKKRGKKKENEKKRKIKGVTGLEGGNLEGNGKEEHLSSAK